MKLSVIICTYDRPELLKQTIDCLSDQTLSTDEFEIIVVYNDEVAGTERVLDNLEGTVPNLRRIPESDDSGGLAHARNIGYKAAESDFVHFLDDDIVPKPDLLEVMWNTFNTVNPTPVCIGGKALPDFEISKPEWLPSSLPGLPVCDLGDDERYIDFPNEFIIGANIAFKKSFLREQGGFPTELGRQQGRLLANEEYELLRHADHQTGVYFQPAAYVDHFIGQERLQIGYFLRRHYWQGVSDWRMKRLQRESDEKRRVFRSLARCIAITGKDTARLAIRLDNRSRAAALFSIAGDIGYLLEGAKSALNEVSDRVLPIRPWKSA